MEDQTTRQRVVQAVNNGYELKDELELKIEAWRAAQAEQGTVRVDTKFEKAKEKAIKAKEVALKKINKTHEDAVRKASLPYSKAQTIYDVAMGDALVERDKTTLEVEAAYTEMVGETQHAMDMEKATAQSAVHRAKDEVDKHQDTIQQNAKLVKEALGIDLNELVV